MKEKSKGKGIKSHEYELFKHIEAECPTYLKRKMPIIGTTWSDDGHEEEEPNE